MILVTFKEFKEKAKEAFDGEGPIDLYAKNLTMTEHAGHSDYLYEIQVGSHAVRYGLDKLYYYFFDGTTGAGETLLGAIEDHAKKYAKRII